MLGVHTLPHQGAVTISVLKCECIHPEVGKMQKTRFLAEDGLLSHKGKVVRGTVHPVHGIAGQLVLKTEIYHARIYLECRTRIAPDVFRYRKIISIFYERYLVENLQDLLTGKALSRAYRHGFTAALGKA